MPGQDTKQFAGGEDERCHGQMQINLQVGDGRKLLCSGRYREDISGVGIQNSEAVFIKR